MIGTFGDIVFETSADRMRTWSRLTRKSGVRVAWHPVMGKKPVPEFIGPEADEVAMRVRFDVGLGVVPYQELARLQKVLDAGESRVLMVGGSALGRFVLLKVNENWRRVDNTGRLLVASVSLSLKEDGHGG